MVLNIFGRGNQRNDRTWADCIYGPRRRNGSLPEHISWSNPVETQPLAPDGGPPQVPVEPFIPLYSFSPHAYRNFARAAPRHRSMQPQRGILRPTPQPSQHQPLGSPNSGLRGRSFTSGSPCNRNNASPFRRRTSSPFTGGYRGQHDSPFQRYRLEIRTPQQPTVIQSAFFPPPPTPAQPTFGFNNTTQQSNGNSSQPMQILTETPSRTMPELPQELPSLMQWNFPTGSLAWSPHPAPHPNVPATTFWGGNSGLQGLPQNTRQYPSAPLDPRQTAQLTGGWPLPGADPRWTPGTWPPVAWGASVPVQLAPCLIPNPANPDMPQLVWDISQNPVRAQRITGAHAIISLGSQFHQQATVPAAEEVHIAVQSAFVERFWGPIKVSSKTKLTVWDILFGIYTFFQTPLTQTEVDYMQTLDENNYDSLVEACRARCNVTPALPGFERLQGLKRIDILGDKRGFWGLWITFDEFSNTWHLNLGLVNLRPGLLGW